MTDTRACEVKASLPVGDVKSMKASLTSPLRMMPGVRGRRLASATLTILAAALVTAVPGASASTRYYAHAAQTCVNASTPAVAASPKAMRNAVVCLINTQRVARHLPALHQQSRLNRSAQGWTNQMVASGRFSHGSDFSSRITAAGFDWSNAGENIASGFATPLEVVNAWMASTGHCQNILSPSYADVGTGVSNRAVRGSASGPATWTQDFGLPMGQHAPSDNSGPANGCPYSA
jgi:uncharacterized protein YkwD